MGMYATIKGHDYKFSGLMTQAYIDLFGAPQDCAIKLKPAELARLINQFANLIDFTPLTIDASYKMRALQSVLSRQQELARLTALIDYSIDCPCDELIFA